MSDTCRTCTHPAVFRVAYSQSDGTRVVELGMCVDCAASLARRVGKATLIALDKTYLRPAS